MSTPRLQMIGIRKTFPGTIACDGASLEVAPGEVHCLVGENGAGKSVLMKVLAGAYQADEGQILLDGSAVQFGNPVDGIRAGVSVIYQELDLVPDMTVAQNLFLANTPSHAGWVQQGQRNAMAAEIIKRVGGRFRPTALVRNLSVADQQLTAIGKALTTEARVIVMDEPSAALTERELPAVFALIRRMVQEGRSVIYISHRLDEVMEVGDRATVLRDGKTVARFDLATATEEDLVTAMIGRRPEAAERLRKDFGASPPALGIRRLGIPGLIDVAGIAVHQGEIVGLAGLSGAGRTTVLAALFGSIKSDSSITLLGRHFEPKRPGVAVRAGIGLVPEDRKNQGLLRALSVLRNASLAALPITAFRPRSLARLLTAGPLKNLAVKYASLNQPAGQLSGGNQQKVVFAKWLARGVKLLLLDEPTRGIDIGAKEELFKQVHRLADSGVPVLMASSELSELTAHADTIWVMYEGKNVAQFDPRRTAESEIAHTVVTGKVDHD